MGADFRIISDFPAYRVGDDGSVWCRWIRCGRGEGGGRGSTTRMGNDWRQLKLVDDHLGYSAVTLCGSGRQRHARVHEIVLETFVGPKPSGHLARHLNDVGTDNRLENLCWGTRLENGRDASRNGKSPSGGRNGGAKLTETAVRKIRAMNGTHDDIAKRFGVARATVSLIKERKTWKKS